MDKERPDKITGNLARRDVPIAPKVSVVVLMLVLNFFFVLFRFCCFLFAIGEK